MAAAENARLIQRVIRSHLEHDLQEEDRQALKDAAASFVKYISLGTILGGGLLGSVAFRGKYAWKNLRNLEPLMHRETRRLDQEVLKDRLFFGTRFTFLLTFGMLAGMQVGANLGFRASNRILETRGNKERIAKALAATRRELESSIKGSRSTKSQDIEEVDGEDSRLAQHFERDQPQDLNEESIDALPDPVESDRPRFDRSQAPTPDSQSAPTSRWEELRNRSTKPSSWARIRQDQAKSEMEKRREDEGDPRFRNRDLEAEQRAFDALMEKERRGGDSNGSSGFLPEPTPLDSTNANRRM